MDSVEILLPILVRMNENMIRQLEVWKQIALTLEETNKHLANLVTLGVLDE